MVKYATGCRMRSALPSIHCLIGEVVTVTRRTGRHSSQRRIRLRNAVLACG